MFAPVYLDHNATTPLHPAALTAMLPWLEGMCGNASSRHDYGRAAREAVETARRQVAEAVGATPGEVIFTSGGSEANNLIIKGMALGRPPGVLAVSAIEHPCVLRPARQLASLGWKVIELPVDGAGRVLAGSLAAVAAQRPALVSVMLANNETGTVQDVAALAPAIAAVGGVFHSDAAQVLGRRKIDFRALNAAGVQAITLSAHKAGGPKGAAALIVDKRLDLWPLIAGGGQERGLRSGTENVPAIVAFGVAAAAAAAAVPSQSPCLAALRDRLENGVQALGGICFGQGAERLPNTSYFAFAGIEGETLVGKLDRAGFAVASGAACSSAQPEPSHVLAAMGVDPLLARGAVRVSLGAGIGEREIEAFIHTLQTTVGRLQGLAAIAA